VILHQLDEWQYFGSSSTLQMTGTVDRRRIVMQYPLNVPLQIMASRDAGNDNRHKKALKYWKGDALEVRVSARNLHILDQSNSSRS
jgi:hypothetical protein